MPVMNRTRTWHAEGGPLADAELGKNFPREVNLHTIRDPVSLVIILVLRRLVRDGSDPEGCMLKLRPGTATGTAEIFLRLDEEPATHDELAHHSEETLSTWSHACREAANTLVRISEWLRGYGVPDTAQMSAITLDDTTDEANDRVLNDYHQFLCETGSHEAVLQALFRLPLALQRMPMTAAVLLRLAIAAAHSNMFEYHCPPTFTMWAATAREASRHLSLRCMRTAAGRQTIPLVGGLEHLFHDVTEISTDMTMCKHMEALSRIVRLETLLFADPGDNKSTWMALMTCMERLSEESRNTPLSPVHRLRQLRRDLADGKLMEHPVPPGHPSRRYVLHLGQHCINPAYAFGRRLGGDRAAAPALPTWMYLTPVVGLLVSIGATKPAHTPTLTSVLLRMSSVAKSSWATHDVLVATVRALNDDTLPAFEHGGATAFRIWRHKVEEMVESIRAMWVCQTAEGELPSPQRIAEWSSWRPLPTRACGGRPQPGDIVQSPNADIAIRNLMAPNTHAVGAAEHNPTARQPEQHISGRDPPWGAADRSDPTTPPQAPPHGPPYGTTAAVARTA